MRGTFTEKGRGSGGGVGGGGGILNGVKGLKRLNEVRDSGGDGH